MLSRFQAGERDGRAEAAAASPVAPETDTGEDGP